MFRVASTETKKPHRHTNYYNAEIRSPPLPRVVGNLPARFLGGVLHM